MDLSTATEKVTTRAANAAALGASIKFSFDEGQIFIDGSGDANTVNNEDAESTCTIKMTLADFHSMLDGDLNPMAAFMAGKFKLEGDMGVAMKLNSMFG